MGAYNYRIVLVNKVLRRQKYTASVSQKFHVQGIINAELKFMIITNI